MAKFTRASFKSWVRKNRENLLVKTDSTFDGMTDCVMPVEGSEFTKAREEHNKNLFDHTLGVKGIWLVGGGRDYFEPYEDRFVKGYRVYNCVGSFKVAINK